jgi:hypothetical protein
LIVKQFPNKEPFDAVKELVYYNSFNCTKFLKIGF